MSRRPRDSQRSRLYEFETHASTTLARLGGQDGAGERPAGVFASTAAEFASLSECQALVDVVWTDERVRYGLGRMAAPLVVRPNRGQRRPLAHADHRISLPRWSRSRWTVLHEVAHRLSPSGPAHGPRFVGILIGLLCRHAGYSDQNLLRLAHEFGLRVSVQSIGSVPARPPVCVPVVDSVPGGSEETLGERLLPLLPTTDVWAAIELGVHWRQVRGAALHLVARGRARWRGTTLVRRPG